DEAGNFEGRSIPNLLGGTLEQRAGEIGMPLDQLVERLGRLHDRLRAARERRVRPGTDDKILTAWNGLMVSAFARAYQAFGREADLDAARAALGFVASRMLDDDRVRVSYRAGRAKLNGYLDDYAFLGRGALDLYEASFDDRWLTLAERLARSLSTHFADRDQGGFWFVSHDHEGLIARNRSAQDGALPSGAGVAVELLLRLAAHLDDDPFRELAERALAAYRPAVDRAPSAFASLLIAADWARGPLTEVAIVGASADRGAMRELLDVVHARFRPRLVLAAGSPVDGGPRRPLLAGKQPLDGRPTAFVCRDYACRQPVTTAAALAAELDRIDG
ncbi:MAG TPA: hypothetical protein VD788_01670, partial [Candidatus Polarisedimenticolaceae bacterium]|nr:hypothetical protein [Candidatus Polarisedimenticolaceae bacterium]